MDRRDFNKATLGALIGLIFVDEEKAEARVITKEMIASMTHEQRVELAHKMHQPIRCGGLDYKPNMIHAFENALQAVLTDEISFKNVAANPKDERLWLNHKTSGSNDDVEKTVIDCDGIFASGYQYKNYPPIYPDERIPRGFIWNFNSYNESVLNSIQEHAEFVVANLEERELHAGAITFVYSAEEYGRFLSKKKLDAGKQQLPVDSALILI